jgi:DNA-binding beta-propeller fold protein YncE
MDATSRRILERLWRARHFGRWAGGATLLALLLLAGMYSSQPLNAQRNTFGPPYLVTGSFVLPVGLALDGTHGQVLVADAGDQRVWLAPISDLTGMPVWSDFGYVADQTLPEALHGPQAVAVDAQGNAYVVDTFDGEVQLYRRDAVTGHFAYDPSFAQNTRHTVAGVDIQLPRDIAVGANGQIYLLDSGNGRILVATGPDDSTWAVWRQNAEWGNPYGLDVAVDGTVYLADTDHHRIWRLTAAGSDTAFGHFGAGDGQFRSPRDVAVAADGRLFVADTNNHRVVALHADGSHDLIVDAAPLFDTPQKLVVDGQNRLFVLDTGANGLVAYLGPVAPPFDAYVRDYPDDRREEPSAAAEALLSPDLLVRLQPDVDLALAEEQGLSIYPFQQPHHGENHYVYLAVRNRGTHPIFGVTAGFYWADPATSLLFPQEWHAGGFYTSYISDTLNVAGNQLFVPSIAGRYQAAFWTHQFGTTWDDSIHGLVSNGLALYAVGFTGGALPGQTSAGGSDAFVRRYTPNGGEIWTRQFGSASRDGAYEVDLDASGIYIAGFTEGVLPGQTGPAGADGFVRKYDADGTELWTHQFASTSTGGAHARDFAFGLAVDGSGVYVAGMTNGILPGQTNTGGNDAFVRKYDTDGIELWTRQFGTPGQDRASAVALALSGVYVAGDMGSAFFVRKYDPAGNELWTEQFGTAGGSDEVWVTADGSAIYVAGTTGGALPGQTSAGQQDAFVRRYDIDGNEEWTRQFGTAGEDRARTVKADRSGVYVAGLTGVNTDEPLPGQTSSGGVDASCASMILRATSCGPASSALPSGPMRLPWRWIHRASMWAENCWGRWRNTQAPASAMHSCANTIEIWPKRTKGMGLRSSAP